LQDSNTRRELSRDQVLAIVLEAVAEALEPDRGVDPESLGPQTALIGSDAVVDSLGLVQILTDVEETVSDQSRVQVDLTDERALSQAKSPFRTAEALVDHVLASIGAPQTS
jgi:acyl carrier protein